MVLVMVLLTHIVTLVVMSWIIYHVVVIWCRLLCRCCVCCSCWC